MDPAYKQPQTIATESNRGANYAQVSSALPQQLDQASLLELPCIS